MSRADHKYRVVVKRENGAWLVRVPSVPGCHTYGRTLAQARERIREALSLWVDNANDAELFFAVDMPPAARDTIRRLNAARRNQERWHAEAQRELWRAARTLTKRSGLSLRDAADLLEISHQRVAQVLDEPPKKRPH